MKKFYLPWWDYNGWCWDIPVFAEFGFELQGTGLDSDYIDRLYAREQLWAMREGLA